MTYRPSDQLSAKRQLFYLIKEAAECWLRNIRRRGKPTYQSRGLSQILQKVTKGQENGVKIDNHEG
jgi:hypothetical protein